MGYLFTTNNGEDGEDVLSANWILRNMDFAKLRNLDFAK